MTVFNRTDEYFERLDQIRRTADSQDEAVDEIANLALDIAEEQGISDLEGLAEEIGIHDVVGTGFPKSLEVMLRELAEFAEQRDDLAHIEDGGSEELLRELSNTEIMSNLDESDDFSWTFDHAIAYATQTLWSKAIHERMMDKTERDMNETDSVMT